MANETVLNASQFPWSALITACTGLIGALGGAILANKFAEKRWLNQVKHEDSNEKEKVLRDKGEELYVLLGRWSKLIFLVQLAQIRYVKSNREWSGYEDHVQQLGFEPGAHDRILTLLELYFTELAPLMDQVRSHIQTSNSLHENFKRGLEVDAGGVSNSINKASIDVELKIKKMQALIRERLKPMTT